MIQHVVGFCPACGLDTLHLMPSRILHCLNRSCPQPATAHRILMDRQIQHVARVIDGIVIVRHPLRERVDEDLFSCSLALPEGLDEGTYVHRPDGDHAWEPVDDI